MPKSNAALSSKCAQRVVVREDIAGRRDAVWSRLSKSACSFLRASNQLDETGCSPSLLSAGICMILATVKIASRPMTGRC